MNRPRRPAIVQIGRVIENIDAVWVTGWGLGLCMAGCLCHRNPTGGLSIRQDVVRGYLGLISFGSDPDACDCCEPWRTSELQQILRDFDRIAQVPTAADVDEPTEKEEPA